MPTQRYICSNVIRPHTPRARACEKPARWQFWDSGMSSQTDHPYYSCAGCLSSQLEAGYDKTIVQRIEY